MLSGKFRLKSKFNGGYINPVTDDDVALHDIQEDENQVGWHPEQEFNEELKAADMYHNRDPLTKEPKKKIDPYFAMKGVSTGLSWLSGVVDRKKQNQYMQQQYSTLGQLDPIPASNFQPNAYSLYAKYGGSLKKYPDGGKIVKTIPGKTVIKITPSIPVQGIPIQNIIPTPGKNKRNWHYAGAMGPVWDQNGKRLTEDEYQRIMSGEQIIPKMVNGGEVQPPSKKQSPVKTLPTINISGKKPIYTNNPNDPRLKSYQDSLSLYNKSRYNLSKIDEYKELKFRARNHQEWAEDYGSFLEDVRTEAYKDYERTGIAPDRQFIYSSDKNLKYYDRYEYGYKKPVQPIIYGKPKVLPKKDYPLVNPSVYKSKTKIKITPSEQTQIPIQDQIDNDLNIPIRYKNGGKINFRGNTKNKLWK